MDVTIALRRGMTQRVNSTNNMSTTNNAVNHISNTDNQPLAVHRAQMFHPPGKCVPLAFSLCKRSYCLKYLEHTVRKTVRSNDVADPQGESYHDPECL